jgi:hypothetical protein
MRYGQPWGAGFGDPEHHIAAIRMPVQRGNTALDVYFTPAAGLGDAYFQIYYNNVPQRVVYAAEGYEAGPFPIAIPRGSTRASVVIMRMGSMNDSTANFAAIVRTLSLLSGELTAGWRWPYQIFGPTTERKSSAWAMTGLRYSQTLPVATRRSWSFLYYTIALSGGTVTVTVSNETTDLAQGTVAAASLPATVTLSALNDSGLTGSVQLPADYTAIADAPLYVRWPAQMDMLYGASNPPSSLLSSTLFNNRDTGRMTVRDVAAGTWYFALRAVTDTGVQCAPTTATQKTFVSIPEPPTDVAANDGDADETIVSWNAVTVGAAYNVYAAIAGEALRLVGTTAANAESFALPAFTAPGRRAVLVRAVNSGIEEQNANFVYVDYDADGEIDNPQPNTPSIDAAMTRITSAYALSIRALYDTAGQLAAPEYLELWSRAVDGTYGADPDATAAPSDAGAGWLQATLTETYGADGQRWVKVSAISAAGRRSGFSAEMLVFLCDDATDAALDVSFAEGEG